MANIRPLALAVIQRGSSILVMKAHDSHKRETFYRPLGGGIDFGEPGAAALAREFREELNEELAAVRLLGVLENIFTYEGRRGHELALIFAARFRREEAYQRETYQIVEPTGPELQAVWLDLRACTKATKLYPDGLFDLIAPALAPF